MHHSTVGVQTHLYWLNSKGVPSLTHWTNLNIQMFLAQLKAIGGVWGVFCMLSSYKSVAPYRVSAFYGLLISRSVLKICFSAKKFEFSKSPMLSTPEFYKVSLVQI